MSAAAPLSLFLSSPPLSVSVSVCLPPLPSFPGVSVPDGVRGSPGRGCDLPGFSHSAVAAMIRIFPDFSVQVTAAPGAGGAPPEPGAARSGGANGSHPHNVPGVSSYQQR